MAADERVLPCDDPGPVRKALSTAERRARREAADGARVKLDPASLSPREAVEVFERMRAHELDGNDRDSGRWLSALVNQISSSRSSGLRALTPLYSPSGQMTLHQLYRDHLSALHRNKSLIAEALMGWRRHKGTGANLDARALRDAVTSSAGEAENAAVTGASWLALMAVPLFRQASGPRPAAIGWETAARGGACLRWPIWTKPLDRAAVEVLLGHPAVAATRVDAQARRRKPETALRVLGVEAVCRSRRRALDNSAGALLPPVITAAP
jgi:hypothetical protein